MSALYVDGIGAPVSIRLEGAGLSLERPDGPQGRVPLRRLSRLVLRGPATLDGPVLPALLRAGIPVSFLDSSGRPLGTLLPTFARRTDTRALLEEAEERGLLDRVRGSWKAAEERRLLLDLATGLGIATPELHRPRIERRLLAALDRIGAPLDGEELVGRMRGLLESHLACLLFEEGLGWSWQGGDPEHWNLRADLADVLILALLPALFDLARFLAAHPERHRTPRALHHRFARRYEREAPRIARLCDHALARLRRILREELA